MRLSSADEAVPPGGRIATKDQRSPAPIHDVERTGEDTMEQRGTIGSTGGRGFARDLAGIASAAVFVAGCCATALLAGPTAPARAEAAYPSRTVQLIIAYGA